MSRGYLYCMSNPSMPGIFKVGMTKRTPEIRLKEANMSDTWRPPTNYQIEFSIYVKNPLQKEVMLHRVLKRYFDRIHDGREFFRAPIEDIRLFFDLMDDKVCPNLAKLKPLTKREKAEILKLCKFS